MKDLGILKISKSLGELTNSEKKSQVNLTSFFSKKIESLFIYLWLHSCITFFYLMVQQRLPKLRSKTTIVSEPRRSSRARNPVSSYRDDVSNNNVLRDQE